MIPSVTNAREDVSAVFVVLWDVYIMLEIIIENTDKLCNIKKYIRYQCEMIDFFYIRN